jgi:hypothetical protein
MNSVYRLVAERRDKNQSIKRKRNMKNFNIFRNYVEEVPLDTSRGNNLSQPVLRKRTISDQLQAHRSSQNYLNKRLSNDVVMNNLKNHLQIIEEKLEILGKKVDDLSVIYSLKKK